MGKYWISIFLLLVVVQSVRAQEGILTYKVIEMNIPDSISTKMPSGIKDVSKWFTMRIYFKRGQTRTEMEAMNGLVYIQNFWKEDKQELTVFSDLLGRRQKVIVPKAELDKFMNQSRDTPQKMDLVRPGQRKSIMGLSCELVRIQDYPGEFWICPDIRIPAIGYGLERFGLTGLGGLPLEYSLKISGFNVVVRAVDLTNKISKDDFIYPGGYETIQWGEYLKHLEGIR